MHDLFQNGKWNGLMGELVAKKFDMVLTSLKVNAEREAAVDFTSPFLSLFTFSSQKTHNFRNSSKTIFGFSSNLLHTCVPRSKNAFIIVLEKFHR